MSKQHSRDEPMHWEAIVRVIIEKIGPEGLAEVIDYVVDEMLVDERLVDFVIEPRQDH